MKRVLIGAIALTFVAACGQKPAEEAVTEERQQLRSGIVLENMDKSVRPGDDFFSFVNGAWVEKTELPADKPSFSVFSSLNDVAQENVKAIIERSATGDFAKGTDEQKVGDLYKSFKDWDTRNARGTEPLQPELDRIAAIASYEDLAVYFGGAVKRGLDAPFGLAQFADMRDPEYYGIYMFQSGLGLPDREYYFTDDEKSQALRDKYLEHIEKMFALAGLPDGAQAAQSIMQLETAMAEQQMKKEDTRNWAANYNKVAVSDLGELMPNFNWDVYFEELGAPDLDSVIVIMTDYQKALDSIIQSTDLETWKTYLTWSALNQTASRLTEDLDKQNFEFYGKALSGTEEQRPLWRRGVNIVNGTLGEVVGKVYVKEHFPPEAKERMMELVGNLIKAYEVSIKDLEWMTEETRAQALDKLSKFTPKIGYPDVWKDYSKLEIDSKDLYGNLERAALVEHQRALDRQGGPVDRTEWAMTPQTVNAYYNPTLNEIVFPAGILQPPFFDLEADDAVNYGAIGAVIGHEIGHGFDDSGSRFDGDGVLRNWWTDDDRNEFEKRTGKLVEQYNAFAPFDDLNVNGEFTLGENIGDLGGISIGLLAYEMSLEGEEPPVLDGFTGIQRVFLGYGQVWRNKYREEALRLQIGTDPHSPAMYRTNGAVRNVPEFYEAFEVAETDELYLPPEERVKIW
ncbi:MAG: M13-type metalloendopeptidase [Woeseiaceae bacterium]|nr:M13-type metalloendopeptidase [Woeseiaceae bacterium]